MKCETEWGSESQQFWLQSFKGKLTLNCIIRSQYLNIKVSGIRNIQNTGSSMMTKHMVSLEKEETEMFL